MEGQAVERACSMAFGVSFNEGSDHDRRAARTARQNAKRSQVRDGGAATRGIGQDQNRQLVRRSLDHQYETLFQYERCLVNGAAWMGQRSWCSPMRRLVAVTVDDSSMSRPHSGDSDANHVRSICLCVVFRRRCGLKCSLRAGTRAVSGEINRRRQPAILPHFVADESSAF